MRIVIGMVFWSAIVYGLVKLIGIIGILLSIIAVVVLNISAKLNHVKL